MISCSPCSVSIRAAHWSPHWVLHTQTDTHAPNTATPRQLNCVRRPVVTNSWLRMNNVRHGQCMRLLTRSTQLTDKPTDYTYFTNVVRHLFLGLHFSLGRWYGETRIGEQRRCVFSIFGVTQCLCFHTVKSQATQRLFLYHCWALYVL